MRAPAAAERTASLGEVVAGHARTRGDGLAFVAGDRSLDWAGYHAAADAVAARLLEAPLAPGDRVAVWLPDGPGVHAVWVGAERVGLVVVGIGPRAGLREVRHLLERTGARALVSPARQRDVDVVGFVAGLAREGLTLAHFVTEGAGASPELRLAAGPALGAGRAAAGPRPGRGLGPDDVWLLNSTSGTTGLPKCVTHDQRRWFHFHDWAVEAGALRADDVFCSALPAPFGFGIWTAHVTPTLLGAPTVLLPRFDPEALALALERHRVTVLAAVTTQFILMLEAGALERHDVSTLRVLFTGGEAVPYERAARFEDATGARVLQFYGSNETGALSRTTLGDSRDVRLRTAGHVIPAMQVRLVDDEGRDVTAAGTGQPACRGPATSRGYWADPEANEKLFTADGWMLTGDVATLRADGVLRVVGRKADFIIRGGKNVSAPAVEAEVATHPAVALAAAVAMPDPVFGERVCVYVELRPGASLTLHALVAHLRARGAGVETLPEALVVVDALPRASGGKIAKQALREDARERARETAPPAR